jgi:hypothetical protein
MTPLLVVAVLGCKKKDDKSGTAPIADAQAAAKAPDAAAAQAAAIDAAAPDAVLRLSGFETPESVLYDDQADVYLVSNISGSPVDKDGKAFISRITPAGDVELRWIDSAKDEVKLDAPKGMAIRGDVLYVADIDVVRMFDRTSGEPKGEIAIDGAGFLNDLASVDGRLWVSDSGLKAGAGGFEPSGTDAIYAIEPDKDHAVTKVIAGAELGNPNGLARGGAGVQVVTFGSGERYDVVEEGDEGGVTASRQNITKLPKGVLDGIVMHAGIPTLVSSWEAQAVFAIADDGTVTELITGVESPADIGYDHKRKRVLIPLFMKDSVEIHPIE